MKREELRELHYIADIRDIRSIMSRGILCKNHADRFRHQSFALDSVQAARSRQELPNGGRIHDHAVLYLRARNATLYRIVMEKRVHCDYLCVLRIHPSVLNLVGAFMSDRNAACLHPPPRFGSVDEILPLIDLERLSAEFWTLHDDPIDVHRHREEMCAELLVPEKIPPNYVRGALVPGEAARLSLEASVPRMPVRIAPRFFFAK